MTGSPKFRKRRPVYDYGVVPAAYHGTSREYAKSIERNGFKASTSGKDRIGYLGYGIYFWLFSVEAAKWWARFRFKKKSKAVLEAEVVLKLAFNLDEPPAKAILNDARIALRKKTGKKPNTEEVLRHDGVVIEFIVKNYLPEVKVVMQNCRFGFNKEGRAPMVCVRDASLCRFKRILDWTEEASTSWFQESSTRSGGRRS